LPPILAIFAGLFLAGLALISAMALVAVSVVAGLGHLIVGRLRGLWRERADAPGDVLTVDYEIVREREDPDDREALPERDPRATLLDGNER
jgi:hypothetical protein